MSSNIIPSMSRSDAVAAGAATPTAHGLGYVTPQGSHKWMPLSGLKPLETTPTPKQSFGQRLSGALGSVSSIVSKVNPILGAAGGIADIVGGILTRKQQKKMYEQQRYDAQHALDYQIAAAKRNGLNPSAVLGGQMPQAATPPAPSELPNMGEALGRGMQSASQMLEQATAQANIGLIQAETRKANAEADGTAELMSAQADAARGTAAQSSTQAGLNQLNFELGSATFSSQVAKMSADAQYAINKMGLPTLEAEQLRTSIANGKAQLVHLNQQIETFPRMFQAQLMDFYNRAALIREQIATEKSQQKLNGSQAALNGSQARVFDIQGDDMLAMNQAKRTSGYYEAWASNETAQQALSQARAEATNPTFDYWFDKAERTVGLGIDAFSAYCTFGISRAMQQNADTYSSINAPKPRQTYNNGLPFQNDYIGSPQSSSYIMNEADKRARDAFFEKWDKVFKKP